MNTSSPRTRGEDLAYTEYSIGGELSRIMLAIKAQLSDGGGIETLLFDEIDAGLGGVVAQYVAEELKALSKSSQVITITHLAQIASVPTATFLSRRRQRMKGL